MPLWIEGTTPHGELGPEGHAPYAIFDDSKQDWIRAGIRWRWLAWLMLLVRRAR